MSISFSRPKTSRQLRHPAARSAAHAADKANAENRRESILVFAPTPNSTSPNRTFSELGLNWHDLIFKNDEWFRFDSPEAFADDLEQRAEKLPWFWQYLSQEGKR